MHRVIQNTYPFSVYLPVSFVDKYICSTANDDKVCLAPSEVILLMVFSLNAGMPTCDD